jgi:hypothetical protein
VVTNVTDPAWLGAANAKLASAAKPKVKINDRLLILPPEKQLMRHQNNASLTTSQLENADPDYDAVLAGCCTRSLKLSSHGG